MGHHAGQAARPARAAISGSAAPSGGDAAAALADIDLDQRPQRRRDARRWRAATSRSSVMTFTAAPAAFSAATASSFAGVMPTA